MDTTKDNDYHEGFADGFRAGWESARGSIQDAIRKLQNEQFVKGPFECSICGARKGTNAYGVPCKHPNCPSNTPINSTSDVWEL